MEKENNIKEYKVIEKKMSKFRAGSEDERDGREEASIFLIIWRKYKPEDQTWILKVCGKSNKKFKAIVEGCIFENAAYLLPVQTRG